MDCCLFQLGKMMPKRLICFKESNKHTMFESHEQHCGLDIDRCVQVGTKHTRKFSECVYPTMFYVHLFWRNMTCPFLCGFWYPFRSVFLFCFLTFESLHLTGHEGTICWLSHHKLIWCGDYLHDKGILQRHPIENLDADFCNTLQLQPSGLHLLIALSTKTIISRIDAHPTVRNQFLESPLHLVGGFKHFLFP